MPSERERLTGGQWTIKVWQECLWLLNAKAKGIYSPVSRIYKVWFDLFLSFWKIFEPCRLRQNFVFECKFKSSQRWRRDATNLNGTMHSTEYHHDNRDTHQQHKLCLLDIGRDKAENIKLWQPHKQMRGNTLTQHKITSAWPNLEKLNWITVYGIQEHNLMEM